MTREKAITIIKPLMLMMKNPQGEVISDAYYALEMAVQALLQEPCEDAVSRGVFEQVMWERDVAIEQLEELGYCLGEKPQTGHWIEHPEIKTSTPKYLMFYECSECGDKQCFCKSDIHKKHFCSNCGSRMVEPQESEVNNG